MNAAMVPTTPRYGHLRMISRQPAVTFIASRLTPRSCGYVPAYARLYSCKGRCRLAASKRQLSQFHHRCNSPFIGSAVAIRGLHHGTPSSDVAASNFAFAFDIDGVLYRSGKPFSGALKALRYLQKHKIPFILLTNGGGKHETDRVLELSNKFGVQISVDNFVQSHTPFQGMASDHDADAPLSGKTILVTGADPNAVRKIAQQYGFKNVITPADILVSEPRIWPFHQVSIDQYKKSAQPLPVPIHIDEPAKSLKIDAIFVFNDPRDWALDIQVILDLLMSKNGVLGTLSEKNGDCSFPNHGWQQDGQPKLIFSNPDLFWATDYNMSRLGQGGFRAALEGVWSATTSGTAPLQCTVIGKPYALTYNYAERVLLKHRAELLRHHDEIIPELERVFMIGDNPESDIRGANTFQSPRGTDWTSILVKTGVWREETEPKYKPKVVVDGVLDGVKWALRKQGYAFNDEDFENL